MILEVVMLSYGLAGRVPAAIANLWRAIISALTDSYCTEMHYMRAPEVAAKTPANHIGRTAPLVLRVRVQKVVHFLSPQKADAVPGNAFRTTSPTSCRKSAACREAGSHWQCHQFTRAFERSDRVFRSFTDRAELAPAS
jgi:hypothetical protein